jgi:DNA repair protein RadC
VKRAERDGSGGARDGFIGAGDKSGPNGARGGNLGGVHGDSFGGARGGNLGGVHGDSFGGARDGFIGAGDKSGPDGARGGGFGDARCGGPDAAQSRDGARGGGNADARDMLEGLIRRADPAADATALSGRLLERYGSLATLLSAPAEDLMRVDGVRAPLAQLLGLMPQLSRYVALDRLGPRPNLSTLRRAGQYLAALYVGRYYEHFHLLCLTREGRLIHAPLITRGTLDETAFYLRNMLDEALKARAHAVVLAHNHPGGTGEPSPGDVAATRHALRAMSRMDICVLDHVIVADGRAFSVRAAGLVDESVFLKQAPGDPLVEGWLG